MSLQKSSSWGYHALCYHYIRPPIHLDPFPKILGTRQPEFHSQIETFKKYYAIISPEDTLKYAKEGFDRKSKPGLLITFDDGLSDHYQAAVDLTERGVKAFFFVPTCIFADQLPANPTIIHYALASNKISKFLECYRNGLENESLNILDYDLSYREGDDNPWETIKNIKGMFKYKIPSKASRKILLYIYRTLILKKYPDALKRMHLTHQQTKKMVEMGHSLGVHSHSHFSVAGASLTDDQINDEIIKPRELLEKQFKQKTYAFSYPFGKNKDCFSGQKFKTFSQKYKLAYTVTPGLNTPGTSSFELKRYMPLSQDTSKDIMNVLDNHNAKKPL